MSREFATMHIDHFAPENSFAKPALIRALSNRDQSNAFFSGELWGGVCRQQLKSPDTAGLSEQDLALMGVLGQAEFADLPLEIRTNFVDGFLFNRSEHEATEVPGV